MGWGLSNIIDPTPYTLKIFYAMGWESLKYLKPPTLYTLKYFALGRWGVNQQNNR